MRLRGFIVIGAILSVAVGFIVGKAVIANSPAPGSSADPVVSKSYVDKALETRVGDLEKEVAELTVQAKALQSTINELQNKGGTNAVSPKPTTPVTPPATTTPPADNKPPQGTGTEKPANEPSQSGSSAVIGKTGYTNVSTVVNLRSAPTTEAGILKKVENDVPMVIQKAENDWYNVKLNDGTVGWIAARYVTVR